jgi:glycine/D-amino acid oxidase-like deaminating enzyme
MTQGSQPRVGVVGAGVLGTSIAAHLAGRGCAVTLVTERALADGASGRSLSWLNSFGRRSAAYHQLRLLGLDRYRILSTRPESVDWLRFDGGLNWAPADELADQREAFEHMFRVGYAAEWLRPSEVAGRTPGVNAAVIPPDGAIFNPGEGWVELPPLVEWLADDLVRHGGRVLTQAGASRVVVEGGRVTAIATAAGERIEVDAAVLATGPAVPDTVAELGVRIPDATPISLLVRTEPVKTALRSVLNTPRVAVRPTPYGTLVLDSAWSEREVGVREDGSYLVRDETVQRLLDEASAVLEGNPTLTLESYGVGPKPIPGDGEPVLGQLAGIPGYYVGFTHSGATLALIAGELLAAEIVTGAGHPLLAPFHPDRFA